MISLGICSSSTTSRPEVQVTYSVKHRFLHTALRARLGLLSLWIFCRDHTGDRNGLVRNGMAQRLSVDFGRAEEQFQEKDRANGRAGDAPIERARLDYLFSSTVIVPVILG